MHKSVRVEIFRGVRVIPSLLEKEVSRKARKGAKKSDFFLSYAREEMTQAERLAEMLQQQGWSVFWDLTIPPGKTWHQVIDSELTLAHCVVVAWSKASIQSSWVLEEADEGKQRGILIPVLFEPVRPPLGFRSIQAVNLADWNGETQAAVFQGLVKAIAGLVGKSDAATQAFQATAPASITTQNGGVELVLIPGGRFMMGSPQGDGFDNEHPQHEVDIRSFYLGRYPVTNSEYARFLRANPQEKQPEYWTNQRFNQPRQPVVSVDWEEACRFAQWAGGRTERWFRLGGRRGWRWRVKERLVALQLPERRQIRIPVHVRPRRLALSPHWLPSR